MGRGRPRAVELGQNTSASPIGLLNIPPGPVYYPTEGEFKDPLGFIYKIRPEAEKYGICKIIPPKSWKPPFALDLNAFMFPTKTQAIHQLQARCASCDPKTFELEYYRFLEEHCGKKAAKKRVVFEGEELNLCKLFNSVKRLGGYDKVAKEKKWGEVFRFVRPAGKISECAKHVLCQLYLEHLCDYEEYYNKLNKMRNKSYRRGNGSERKRESDPQFSSSKRRRKNSECDRTETCKAKEEEHDQICEQCKSGLHGEVMLLCDRCNKGWHIYCLSPPLKQIPPGNWYCLQCLNSEKDSFGFAPGRDLPLDAFRRIADRARKKWFGSASISQVELEKKFWEIVEGSAGEVEVKYGSDLDTSIYGSGFPRVTDEKLSSVEQGTWDEYSASPWNLNNLPKLPGSMLRAVHHSIAGVMVPWLYIGMLFSSFCWHFEDHCFYSMNYLHWGEPKCWYSVPGNEAQAFEKVMRNSLPDLFDAQPDLLFQLVTMLNPRVLQENGVPVYNVVQEPGDFIITFPRSYHGGFNFGLNCAEAVNFAPADWLPHGGFGADLYQLYRKPAVLSHEELLCAVARSEFDSKAAPYLKTELARVYSREKSWRERLWKNGIVNSSAMPPRRKPEYVGTEEDPTCIICQQYLYLSAVVCNCAPSSFVCLEHWEHLCECKPQKRRLLYRHTLAELNDLVFTTDKGNHEEAAKNFRKQLLSSNDPPALSKKVKGGCITHVQLAEKWLMKFSKLFQDPYSSDAYRRAIKEAEQFMWAGHEMDPVRELVKKLIEAQSWAQNVKDCLSKVKSWMSDRSSDVVKVQMEVVNSLLSLNPVPCNEPAHLRLKDFQKEASQLTLEIDSVLSSCSNILVSDLEALYSKTVDCPIYIEESEELLNKLSSVKAWAERVRKCVSETSARVEADIVYKLEKESLSLQVQLPEGELLLDLIRQVECCQSQCRDLLEGSLSLKELELLLNKWDGLAVNITELELLRQYHKDAMSWIARANHALLGISEREDQETVFDELTCLLKDASLLRVKVEELPCLDIELKKAGCRVKALKALRCKMSMDYIEQLLMEASILQIEKEKLFADVSEVKANAVAWEESARHVLVSKEQISEFEDVIRASEEIFVILPSLDEVKDAVSIAKSWLSRSQPFLSRDSMALGSSPLEVETLKELVSDSKLLKLSLREQLMIQTLLDTCTRWEQDACSVLYDTKCLLNVENIDDEILIRHGKSEKQIQAIDSVVEAGQGLGFKFDLVPKLQDACYTLRWCFKALSFATAIPTLEEVETNVEIASHLPMMYTTCSLCSALIDWVNWLKRALEVSVQSTRRRSSLSEAEEVLRQYQNIHVSSPAMISQLQTAIEKHMSWLDHVHLFFALNFRDRSWDLLLQLKEQGSNDAFSCTELDMVFSEIHRIEEWKCRCMGVLQPSVGDADLVSALLQTENSLERSISICEKSNHSNARALCACCSLDGANQKLLTCSTCKDCFHLQCIGLSTGDANDSKVFICPYCHFISSGKISRNGSDPLNIGRKNLKLHKLVELLSDAEHLCLWIQERAVLQQIAQKALDFKARIEEFVEFVLAYPDKDLSIIAKKFCVALKAVHVGGAYDCEANNKLELALARTSWKIRAQRLLDGSQKPSIQVLQRHLKEGLAVGVPSEDYFRQRLAEAKHIGLQWADMAKKVSTDGGVLGLEKVFELITEGENLPVSCEKELKLLRDRSMLYCICRRPYDQRPMIACDKCDEWYHFDCIKLSSLPKIYICPACCMEGEDFASISTSGEEKVVAGKHEVPQTPSPRHREGRRKSKKHKWERVVAMDVSRSCSNIEQLFWKNRKPYRRVARRREHYDSLSPFIFVQNT
ncbi:lysine-specific demethylase JMJ17 isoform X2 [Nicotiana tomentosiformis]|uniref:lysine-specific demethylase JMJ17 isoform X2 n=1 Tax=Nicotiana tomentosiformis TaxID=4098 RepID=UPI000877FCE0|nr:lysine-specific demethylase 5A isoform X2 [Nicotiana tomentosiformis]